MARSWHTLAVRCFLILLGFCSLPQTPAFEEAPDPRLKRALPSRLDTDGSVLPAGAITRLTSQKNDGTRAIYGLNFTPDGRSLMAADSSAEIRFWNVSTRKKSRSFKVDERGSIGEALLSFDGRILVARTQSGPTRATLYTWDTESGRERFHRDLENYNVNSVSISPESSILALGSGRDVLLLDAENGKEKCRLEGHPGDVLQLAFSPDGKLLASADRAGEIRVWDMVAGKLLRTPIRHEGPIHSTAFSLRFSADGAWLACGKNSLVMIWNTATWKKVCELAEHSGGVFDLAFSPDGRTLATVCWDAKVRLFETAAWKKREQFEGHTGRIYRLDYSPDGRLLATGSTDGEVILWDPTGLTSGLYTPEKPLPNAKLEELWRDLRSKNAMQAYDAMRQLAAVPAQAVPLMKERLKPATVGVAEVERLLADLGDEDFAVREQASRALAKLGKAVPTARYQALCNSPSPEVRRRIGELMELREKESPSPEYLMSYRSLEILEMMGTDESQELLNTLAGGAPGAYLTLEAKAALDRLSKRGKQ